MSDNDGSAFITKAEFDSLKNNFQSQLDSYNTGIDSKIDFAIASYLNGLTINKDPDNIYTRFVELVGGKPTFIQSIDRGTESVNEVSVNATYYTRLYTANNLRFILFSGTSTNFYAMVIAGTDDIWSWRRANRGMATTQADKLFDDIPWKHYDGVDNSPQWENDGDPENRTTYSSKYYVNSYYNIFSTGSGTKWLYQTIGNKKYLKYYCPKYYLKNDITYLGNFYKTMYWADSYYLTDNGKEITTTLSTNVVTLEPGKLTKDGTKQSTTYAGNNRYIEGKNVLIKITDGNNYLNSFFSFTTDTWIRAYDEIYTGTEGSTETEYTIPKQQFRDVYYTQSGGQTQTNDIKAQTFKLKLPKLENDTLDGNHNLNEFFNESATSLTGENVTVVSGIPIAKTNNEDENDIKIGIKLKSASNNQVAVRIADKKFDYGYVDSDSLKWDSLINTNLSNYTYANINVTGKKYIYLYVINMTNNENIIIDDIVVTK